MAPVDWRTLYAANRATIERAGGRPLGRTRRSDPHEPVTAPRALVHVPAALPTETAVPLICMLHGCTQDGATFAAATRMNQAADRLGFVVVYPQQERRANQQRCWNWFDPAHQTRDTGEPAAIAAAVRELAEAPTGPRIDPHRIFVAGLSSGGAMAAVLANTHPDVFAAVAVHSGLAYRSASGVGAAFAAMARGSDAAAHHVPPGHGFGTPPRSVPAIVIHGSADRTVAPVNARQVLAQLMAADRLADVAADGLESDQPTADQTERVAGGHAYRRSRWTDRRGALRHELLMVDGLGHAWSGGAAGGSYTDPRGPDATAEICRFFAEVALPDR